MKCDFLKKALWRLDDVQLKASVNILSKDLFKNLSKTEGLYFDKCGLGIYITEDRHKGVEDFFKISVVAGNEASYENIAGASFWRVDRSGFDDFVINNVYKNYSGGFNKETLLLWENIKREDFLEHETIFKAINDLNVKQDYRMLFGNPEDVKDSALSFMILINCAKLGALYENKSFLDIFVDKCLDSDNRVYLWSDVVVCLLKYEKISFLSELYKNHRNSLDWDSVFDMVNAKAEYVEGKNTKLSSLIEGFCNIRNYIDLNDSVADVSKKKLPKKI